MSIKRILLDSNAYLRLANSFHPLLHEPFGKNQYALYLIPEFQKEFDKNPRLANKFGWVNQPEYIENRKHRISVSRIGKEQVNLIYSYLWPNNISEGLGASRIDVRALAYGDALGIPVVTDDFQMSELGVTFAWRHQNFAKLPEIHKRLAIPFLRKRHPQRMVMLNYL